MISYHRLAYAGLATICGITSVVLVLDDLFAHAVCDAAASLIYAALSYRPPGHRPS